MHTKTEHPVSAPAFTLSLCAFILLYFLNMRLDVMEVDAAQYASIGMEMLMNGSWLEVYHGGKDYLDKPPLLFWCNATSMAIFGINTFAAKLPGVLALLLSLLSLFRFCQIWYSLSIARLATLVLASSQAFLLMSNDVKTDGLLSAWIMMALWQGSVFLHKNSLKSILLFSLSLALALMTKGPLGFLLPCGALMLHLLLSRNLKRLLNPRLLLVLPIIALLITPMCIGLYEQFDLHPEKEVYGLKGPSGLRFFFWTQSFGRITGEIYWNNGAPWHFFLLSMLWDFAPWVLFFWLAVIRLLRKTEERKALPEYMSLSLFALGMLGMSASQYKLPHYIFPLFGSCAVITANFLQQQFLQQAIRASNEDPCHALCACTPACLYPYFSCHYPGLVFQHRWPLRRVLFRIRAKAGTHVPVPGTGLLRHRVVALVLSLPAQVSVLLPCRTLHQATRHSATKIVSP